MISEELNKRYTIKELAETKGTSAPVRFALLEMEARLMQFVDRVEQLESANEALRDALEKIAALEQDFESNAAMTAHEWQMFHAARAALGETK